MASEKDWLSHVVITLGVSFPLPDSFTCRALSDGGDIRSQSWCVPYSGSLLFDLPVAS